MGVLGKGPGGGTFTPDKGPDPVEDFKRGVETTYGADTQQSDVQNDFVDSVETTYGVDSPESRQTEVGFVTDNAQSIIDAAKRSGQIGSGSKLADQYIESKDTDPVWVTELENATGEDAGDLINNARQDLADVDQGGSINDVSESVDNQFDDVPGGGFADDIVPTGPIIPDGPIVPDLGVGDAVDRLLLGLGGLAAFVALLVTVYVFGQLFEINVGD